jgi:type I restriction enzyme S subunit
VNDLPSGWMSIALGDLCTETLIGLVRAKDAQRLDGDGVPYVRMQDITLDGKILWDQVVTVDVGEQEYERHRLREGDLLFNTRNSSELVGKTAIVRKAHEGAVANNNIMRIRMDQRILPDFALLQFISLSFRRRLADITNATTSVAAIYAKNLLPLHLVIPPLAEQRYIVDAIDEHLSRIDAATIPLRSAKTKLVLLRRSIVADMLRGDWPLAKFKDVTTNFDGRRVPIKASDRQASQGEYPYYGASGIIDHVDGYLFEGNFVLVAEDGANLLTRSKPVAFPASGRFWVNNHAHVIQTTGRILPEYLMAYLNQIDLSRFVTGSAQPKLTQRNLNSLNVPIPPLDIQGVLVEQLGDLDLLSGSTNTVLSSVQYRSEVLRQSAMSKGISGQLIAQDGKDQPATMALKRIRSEGSSAFTNELLTGSATS